MSNQSLADVYAINFQNAEPGHFTMVPNIIDSLTYELEGVAKRLSPIAKELYRVIRKFGAQTGRCWVSRDHLAEAINCSSGAVSNARVELEQIFNQLEGNPLITITKKKKSIFNKNGELIGKATCIEITIIDIWRYNNACEATSAEERRRQASSPHDGPTPASSPHDGAPREAPSPGDAIKTRVLDGVVEEQQEPVDEDAEPTVVFRSPTEIQLSPEQRRAYDWMLSWGFAPKSATKIVKRYNQMDIVAASEYVQARRKQGEPINSLAAYFTRCLQGRYWEKSSKSS